jgi:hypothetical protein
LFGLSSTIVGFVSFELLIYDSVVLALSFTVQLVVMLGRKISRLHFVRTHHVE